MNVAMWIILALALAGAEQAKSSYCSTNTIPSRTTGMQLTKEPVPFEYGYENKFKSIHCCGKGYRSIEWFKGNVAYPWSAGVSNLIQYPEAANQTLYTQRASRSDAGNYTCRISNETHSEQHTIFLEILEKPLDAPKPMFISKDQWVEEGSDVRIYCEALVGRSYLADAHSDLHWIKLCANNSECSLLPGQREMRTVRDDMDDVIGSYLYIEDLTTADYGTYVCIVKSNDVISKSYVTLHYQYGVWSTNTSPVTGAPLRTIAVCGVGILLLIASLVALHRRCTPRLLLAARMAHARANATTLRAKVLEKEFDVLVCWTAVDAELVRGVLLPTLSLKYNYRVHAVQIDTQPDTWYDQLSAEVARCRSLVAVVSPAQHTQAQLLTALRQLRALPLPPVLVLLQDLPKLKRSSKGSPADCLVEQLRRARLLAWRHVHERAFWTALRLALPLPPPPASAHEYNNQKTTRESKIVVEETKNVRSSSLTALV